MDSVPFDALALVFLCIIIAGVVDATGFEEDCASSPLDLDWKTVCSDYTKIHLSGVLLWIKVV